MSSQCGVWTAKYGLCIFNFTTFVLGTIMLGAGIWLAIDKESLLALFKVVESEHIEHFTEPKVIEQFAYVLIVIGSVMFLVSFLGYCGAIRESRCLLTTYGVFMILLLIAEIVAGGLAVFYQEKALNETTTFLESTITRYYKSEEQTDAVTGMWNEMMTTFSCCGVNDYHDFAASESWLANKSTSIVPAACCVLDDDRMLPRDSNCLTDPNENNSYYQKGCLKVFGDWIVQHRNIIIGVLFGVSIVHLFVIFLAFCLSKAFAKYHEMRL